MSSVDFVTQTAATVMSTEFVVTFCVGQCDAALTSLLRVSTSIVPACAASSTSNFQAILPSSSSNGLNSRIVV